MASHTVYLITGANRGIGFGLTRTLLLRPNTTIIATIRSTETSTTDLEALPTSPTSTLIIAPLSITSSSSSSAHTLIQTLTTQHSIAHISTLIANAGSGSSFLPSLSTPHSSLRSDFETNTLGPIALFQAAYPLLSRSPAPKFVLISSSLGSIGEMEGEAPSLAYGVSKAGANYFVRKVHFECKEVTAVAVHPGWVKTGNGQSFADSVGVKEPPMSLEDSVKGVLEQIDTASRATTSGTFVSYDGTMIAW